MSDLPTVPDLAGWLIVVRSNGEICPIRPFKYDHSTIMAARKRLNQIDIDHYNVKYTVIDWYMYLDTIDEKYYNKKLLELCNGDEGLVMDAKMVYAL